MIARARLVLLALLSSGALADPLPAAILQQRRAIEDLNRFTFANHEGGAQSDALLVIQNDQILVENYARGYSAMSRHFVWSISKSLTATILAAAMQKGVIRKSDSLCRNWSGAPTEVCQVTVDDALNWSSGLNWVEEYEKSDDRTKSSVIQMLYGDGRNDTFDFYVHHSLRYQPGRHYAYSTGDSTVLMGFLQHVVGRQDLYNRLPWELLFGPLGITNVTLQQDAAGAFLGGSGAMITARDLAQVGRLYLQGGQWRGQTVLPADWVTYATTPSKAFDVAAHPQESWPLRHFWRPAEVQTGLVPPDTFSADGHWGQYLYVIPSRQVVAVRFGEDKQERWDTAGFLSRLMKATVEIPPLAAMAKSLAARPRSVPLASVPLSAAAPAPAYKSSLMTIASHFGSSQYCGCREGSRQTTDFCREYVKASPNIVGVKDEPQHVFKGTVFWFFWPSRVQWMGDALGCRAL